MSLSHQYIAKLSLAPHPEGGYYREIYRSQGVIAQPSLPMRYGGGRVYSTAIYYLLESGDVSSLHRLRSDEQWFHIDGSALTIHTIDAAGKYATHRVGKDLSRGEAPFAVVPHGTWFGGTVDTPDSFALVGCIVAPGFDFEDFELAEKTALTAKFPHLLKILSMLIKNH